MKIQWLRKKTTNQLIRIREMTIQDIAMAKEQGRQHLAKIMEDKIIKEVDLILKERS
mgnify:CR=1 FL=1